MKETPLHLQDANELLTSDGFKSNGVWYHGTSSALLESIKEQGLKRSGDQALNDAMKSTMKTIGNNYVQSAEPVFLTQSKELAYYWAQQTVHERSVRFDGEELPVVFEVSLPDELESGVKPDVGARTLLMMDMGEKYMAHLAHIYEQCGFGAPDINLMSADRMEFQNKLGMVYIDKDVAAEFVKELSE